LMRAASFNIYLTRGAKRLQPSPFVMRHKSGARHPSSLIILLHRIRVSELTGAIFLTNCGARNRFMTGQLVTLRNQTSALRVRHHSIRKSSTRRQTCLERSLVSLFNLWLGR
jgi:hypothetical protein